MGSLIVNINVTSEVRVRWRSARPTAAACRGRSRRKVISTIATQVDHRQVYSTHLNQRAQFGEPAFPSRHFVGSGNAGTQRFWSSLLGSQLLRSLVVSQANHHNGLWSRVTTISFSLPSHLDPPTHLPPLFSPFRHYLWLLPLFMLWFPG